LQLARIQRRVAANHRAKFSYDPALVPEIALRCTEVQSGARNIDHILTRTLLPALSTEFLSRMAEGQPIQAVHVSLDDQGGFRYQLS
jgi:type VI secretion system protein VasG